MNDRDNTPKTPTNRPGLSQIAYRISDYNAFFRRLLDLLLEKAPLAKLTTRSTEDTAIALIDAWAIVADVLTFYQERFANEGYLRTATERRSLLELARGIGYELNPGVAASTYLTFTVEEAPDSPTVAKIPIGTQVMSVPEGEELPQNFEMIEDFTAYVQWNVIKPRLTRPPKITPQTNQLYLSGTDTQLEAGNSLLLLDEENPDSVYLLNLTSVETNSPENYTLVQWEVPPLPAPLDTPLRRPQLFAFREQAFLFGSNAPEWETLSPEIKRTEIDTYGGEIEGGVIKIVSQNNNNNWQSNLVGKELPNLDISALVINQGGDLFAAIPSQGVFRLIAGSDRWVPINDGLTNFNIQSLYVNDKGHLFAGGSNGTAGGGAFRSKDNGNSWTEIATGTIGVQPDSDNSSQFIAVNTSISNTVVRSFLTYEHEENRKLYIFVGTDNGVYRSEDGGKNWKQFNNISVNNDNDNNSYLENTVVRSLVLYSKNQSGNQTTSEGESESNSNAQSSSDIYLFAGTDSGVFQLKFITNEINENSPSWSKKNTGIDDADPADLDIQILISHNQEVLYAGTANGKVYKFPDSNNENEEQWEKLGENAIDSQKITALAVNSSRNILVAGTERKGIYYYQLTSESDNQTKWKPISIIPQGITSLAVNKDTEEFFAGTKFAGFPQEEWPNFEINDRPIQLDTLYPQILNNSLIVLVNGEHFEYRRVQSISTPLVSGFELSAQITQIEPNERLREPNKFNRRTTNVLVQSEPLELAPEILTIAARGEEIFQEPIQQETFLEPIQQDFNQTKTIFLSQFIENLQSDRKIIISGKHIRTQINDIGGILRPAKWQQIRSLTERAVYSLVANISNIFAGSDRGIYRSSNNGENWELLGLPEVAVFSLKIHNNDIFAGSNRGIHYSSDNGENWEPVGVLEVAVFSLAIHSIEIETENVTYIFAGSDQGIYRFGYNDNKWQKTSNESLAQAQVFSLEIYNNYIFAGSDRGLYRSSDNGENWEKTSNESLAQAQVFSLEIYNNYIFAGSDRGIYRSSDNGETWENKSNESLAQAQVVALAIDNNYIFAGTDSGSVLRSTNYGDNWMPIDAGLRGTEVRSLLAIDNNNLLAATEVGIFRSPDNGANIDPIKWEPSNRGLTNSQVRSLVMNSEETVLLAGTTQGIFRSLDHSKNWEAIDSWKSIENKLENKNIQALLLTQFGLIFVGTAEGLFSSQDEGFTWQQIKEDTGLIYSNILTLAVNDIDNTLLVGTSNGGLFQSKNNGKSWTSVGLYNTDVQTIAIQNQLSDNYSLFVGTTQKGIFRSIDKGNSWEQVIDNRPGRGRILSNNNQVTWVGSNFKQQIKAGDTINAAGQTRTVTDVPNVPENTTEVVLFVDNPFRSDLVGETPFTINTGLTNRSITAVAAGSRVGLGTIIEVDKKSVRGEGTEFTKMLKVGDTISIVGANGKIETQEVAQIKSDTDLDVNQDFQISFSQLAGKQYLINKDLIFAGSSGSGVFRSKDNGDRWEQINVNLTNLEIRCLSVDLSGNVWVGTSTDGVFRSNNNGDFWIPFNDNLANIDVRAIVVSQANSNSNKIFVGGIGILISPDGFKSTTVQRQDVLEVLKAPTPRQQEPLYQKWSVKDKDGFEGDLKTALPSQEFTLNYLTLLPAAEESEVVSEVAMIAIPPNDEQLPLLTLREPLKNSYDPETVDIYANVVQATHGETVEEVLGSGDGNASNQRFTLQEPPLTYVSAPTASGAESTLEVRVNGVLWQEVPSLYPLKPQDQNYIIRIEDDGTTTVTFGDGVKGSRLPTGLENITATYRQGIGTEGNVGAKSLSVLNSTPPAIAEVINPLPANGGTAAETLKQVREKAPSTVRILDRIVSLQDFEDFARSFTGIGKAIASDLWSEQTQVVHITIASDAGDNVPQESMLYTSLIEAINAARDPLQQVVVDSYQPLPFNIEAKLLVNPRYQSEVVEQKARDALKNTFDFQVRNFGQPVTAAEAIATIQKVEGVTAVDLDALYQSVRSKALNQSLSASLARYDPINNQILPAQMLLLNSAGIKLTIVPTL